MTSQAEITESESAPRLTIVIAWVVIEMEWDGVPFAQDLGAAPGMIDVKHARAVTWLLSGGESDVANARKAAESIDASARVYTFDTAHRDPLGAARKSIMSRRKAA